MPTDSQCLDATPAADLTLPAPARAAVPEFGDYEVVAELGEGGMGRVYKAVDHKLSRFVAIKVLKTADPAECSRFRGEAALIATLEHPNIVQIFSIDQTPDGRPYLVLELAEGGSLDRELNRQPQEPRRAAEMMETVARAVQFAHDKGVIHRDLKPANVLRGKDKVLKLTDFGLAKNVAAPSGMTASNAVMGTPTYMAPEAAEGKARQLDAATDVYGLGVILYEMLTGRPPFQAPSVVEVLEQVKWAEPAAPSLIIPRLSRDLSTICLKCLQKSPGRRYQTAGELADDLRRWMNGETIVARPAPGWERLLRQVKRRPWEAATLATSALLVALLAGGLLFARDRDRQKKAEDAQRAARDAAEREIHALKEEDARRREKEQDDNAERLRERDRRSLEALHAIYRRVTSPELKATPGLQGLHEELARYYERHIDESLRRGRADRAEPELAALAFDVGELVYQSGLLDRAEVMFAKAHELYARLAAADPGHRARHGDAAVKVARALYARKKDAEARAACDRAERLWADLREAPGHDRAARDHATLQLAEVEHIRGELWRRQSDRRQALAAFNRAVGLRAEFAGRYQAMTPAQLLGLPADEQKLAIGYLRELGRGYGYRGDEHLSLAPPDVPAADRDYGASHDVREKVLKVLEGAPGDSPGELDLARFQLARSWDNLAGFQIRYRAYTTARRYAESALELRKKLIESSPNNAEYRSDLASTLTQIAELMLLERPGAGPLPPEVLRAAGSAVEAAEKLSAGRTGAQLLEAAERLSEALALRAEVSADPVAAAADAARVLALLDDPAGMGRYPGNPVYQFRRAAMHALRGEDGPALGALEKAYQGGYAERHPDDARQRRYFRKLADNPRFQKAFAPARP